MPGRWSPETVRQLQSALVTRREMMDWTRCIVDDFFGDSIDARWSPSVGGSGVAAALQTDNPSRILLDTGATGGSLSQLTETGFNHWHVDDRLTVRVRSRINSIALVNHGPIVLDFDASNRILIQYNTNLGDTGWVLRTSDGGVTTTSAVLLAADTDWNMFDLSIQPGRVAARINGGAVVVNTATIPDDAGDDLRFRTWVFSDAAAVVSKTSEVDLIMLWPGLAIF